jgi:hypothetical protein
MNSGDRLKHWSYHILLLCSVQEVPMPFENPPLWVWTIIAGIMVAGEINLQMVCNETAGKGKRKKSKTIIIFLIIPIRIMTPSHFIISVNQNNRH